MWVCDNAVKCNVCFTFTEFTIKKVSRKKFRSVKIYLFSSLLLCFCTLHLQFFHIPIYYIWWASLCHRSIIKVRYQLKVTTLQFGNWSLLSRLDSTCYVKMLLYVIFTNVCRCKYRAISADDTTRKF